MTRMDTKKLVASRLLERRSPNRRVAIRRRADAEIGAPRQGKEDPGVENGLEVFGSHRRPLNCRVLVSFCLERSTARRAKSRSAKQPPPQVQGSKTTR